MFYDYIKPFSVLSLDLISLTLDQKKHKTLFALTRKKCLKITKITLRGGREQRFNTTHEN